MCAIRKIVPAAVAVVAFAASAAFGGAGANAAEKEIRAFSVPKLEELGRELFKQDSEAATATDLLFAQKLDLDKEGLSGWIVQSRAEGDRVRFVRQSQGTTEAAFDITFDASGKPAFAAAKDKTLSAEDLAQYAARQLVLRHIERPCSQNYNVVIIRDPETKGWLAWALAATTNSKVAVVGGHYRFTISEDGKNVLRSDALSAGCLELPLPDRPKDVAALFATHMVSKTPLESHVYVSLAYGIPWMIGIGKDVWSVKDGNMVKVK
jgi:hypothetical protein